MADSEAAAPREDGEMKAETFFSTAEKERIAKAVEEVERNTAGEVAVMVVDQSEEYPEARILAGTVGGLLIALAITDVFLADNLWYFVPLFFVLSVLGCRLAGCLPPFIRIFTPGSRLEEQVRKRALIAFYEKGLYDTRDDTGVLFFISLLEHKVWVMADKGIYEKISQETLQEYASDIALGIKTGRAAENLCREIGRVGEILAEHFPVKPDDTNELSDEVIIGG